MARKHYLSIILVFVEIIINVINLVILSKSNRFNENYLSKMCNKYSPDSDKYCQISKLIEELESPKETSIAILVFGSILGVDQLIKICVFCSDDNEYDNSCSSCIFGAEAWDVIPLFLNWCMAISIITKLNDKAVNEIIKKMFSEIKSYLIIVVVLYSLCYIIIIFEHLCYDDNKCCCCDKKENLRVVSYANNYNNNYHNRNTYNNDNISSNSRNINTATVVQVQTITTNSILTLRDIIPPEIYRKLQTFIEKGKEKLKKLVEFYINMKFVGLTTSESIKNEIISLIKCAAMILIELKDPVAKVCLEFASEDNLMLLMHYAFPYIMELIRLKIELGIYKRSINIVQENLIHVLTQVQSSIEADEQGNIKLNFRVTREINRGSLIRVLNQ